MEWNLECWEIEVVAERVRGRPGMVLKASTWKHFAGLPGHLGLAQKAQLRSGEPCYQVTNSAHLSSRLDLPFPKPRAWKPPSLRLLNTLGIISG